MIVTWGPVVCRKRRSEKLLCNIKRELKKICDAFLVVSLARETLYYELLILLYSIEYIG